ncbi:Translation initiation factor 3 subunit b [Linnemannia zychae]|nr:Translation initiation factor 3 subunit b [Linnemannia zychae]
MQPFDLNNLPETEEDIDFSDIEEKYNQLFFQEQEEVFDNVIVVDHLPVVNEAQEEKLIRFLRKIFRNVGEIRENYYTMPKAMNENGVLMSKGFMFIELETVEQATLAITLIDGFELTKSHILAVNRFTDVEKSLDMEESESLVLTDEEEFVEKEYLKSWMTDEMGRDQMVVCHDNQVQVLWNMQKEQPQIAHSKSHWTESHVQWSPTGSYLATFHSQGIALWGGESWKKVGRFVHPSVKLADFSPNERFLVTWSNEPIVVPLRNYDGPFGFEDVGNQIAVWDVKSGVLLRTFPSSTSQDPKGRSTISWPVFKWSPSESYFARVFPGSHISIYESRTMGLLDKKSIKMDSIVDFEWAPSSGSNTSGKVKDDMLAFWTSKVDNQPARVTLLNIPSKDIIRTKSILNADNCGLYWQNQGDFLCVKVDHHTKSKKNASSTLAIFHVREKNIPVGAIEINESVLAIAWEPNGERLAVITTSDPNLGSTAPGSTTLKTCASFYHLDKGKVYKTLPGKSCNTIFWSPKGRHVVLATLRSLTDWSLEFYDLDFEPLKSTTVKNPTSGKVDSAAYLHPLSSSEHYGVTDIEWDPSGRFVASSASVWRHAMESGYQIWDFKGQMLYKENFEKFKQFVWRPRPKTLLSEGQVKDIRKNLLKYSSRFEEQDMESTFSASSAKHKRRQAMLEEWAEWRKRVEADLSRGHMEARLPVSSYSIDNDSEGVEEWAEELIGEKEEVVLP